VRIDRKSSHTCSLDTWTVVQMTAAKFKSLIFSVLGFALSDIANIIIFMILNYFCLIPLSPANKLYQQSDHQLLRIQGATWSAWRIPYGRNLGVLDRSRYSFFQATPQLYLRDWVDSIPDSRFLRKSGSAGNRTRTSGSVGKNSDHYTTEAVILISVEVINCCTLNIVAK
jgi:hypothetical protein